jgi:chemotaxis protein MotB
MRFITIKRLNMRKRLMIPVVAFSAILLISCGANKKIQKAESDLKSAEEQIHQLEEKNSALNNNIESVKKDLAASESRSNALTTEYNNFKKTCQENEEKLSVMREILIEEANNLARLEEILDSAMSDFHDRGVHVYYKNGLVYVSLEDDLMYKSGSAKLGDDGKKALSSLANVLNQYPNLKVIVLGNTDDVKAKKGDNWTLSTERANGVVRVLRDDYKVDPTRLTSAGKGKYNPVAGNETAEGRAKNRRTDIILNPDIDRLWSAIKKGDR